MVIAFDTYIPFPKRLKRGHEDDNPESSTGWYTHFTTIQVNARSVFTIPLIDFVQETGWGVVKPLSEVLERGASIITQVRTPATSGRVKLYSIGFNAKY